MATSWMTRIMILVSFHFFWVRNSNTIYQLGWLSWLTQKCMPCFSDFCFITIFLKNLLPPDVLECDSSVQSNHHELRALILLQTISCSCKDPLCHQKQPQVTCKAKLNQKNAGQLFPIHPNASATCKSGSMGNSWTNRHRQLPLYRCLGWLEVLRTEGPTVLPQSRRQLCWSAQNITGDVSKKSRMHDFPWDS